MTKALTLRELLRGIDADRLLDTPISDLVALSLLALIAVGACLAILSYLDHKFLK